MDEATNILEVFQDALEQMPEACNRGYTKGPKAVKAVLTPNPGLSEDEWNELTESLNLTWPALMKHFFMAMNGFTIDLHFDDDSSVDYEFWPLELILKYGEIHMEEVVATEDVEIESGADLETFYHVGSGFAQPYYIVFRLDEEHDLVRVAYTEKFSIDGEITFQEFWEYLLKEPDRALNWS